MEGSLPAFPEEILIASRARFLNTDRCVGFAVERSINLVIPQIRIVAGRPSQIDVPVITLCTEARWRRGTLEVILYVITNRDLVDINCVRLPVVQTLTDGYACEVVGIELCVPRIPDRPTER